jgi:hypothetical protein
LARKGGPYALKTVTSRGLPERQAGLPQGPVSVHSSQGANQAESPRESVDLKIDWQVQLDEAGLQQGRRQVVFAGPGALIPALVEELLACGR